MEVKPTRNFSLTAEQQHYIDRKLKTGRYASASEVMREALRVHELLEELRELRLQKMRREIEHGYRQAERGDLIDGETVFNEIRRKSKEQRAKRKKA